MNNKFRTYKYVINIVITIFITAGIVYAATNITSLRQNAATGDKITAAWVNLINTKVRGIISQNPYRTGCSRVESDTSSSVRLLHSAGTSMANPSGIAHCPINFYVAGMKTREEAANWEYHALYCCPVLIVTE